MATSDRLLSDLLTTLDMDPDSLDDATSTELRRRLNAEVATAAGQAYWGDTMRTARDEAMDCIHGTDRKGGMDGRFAGPLGLVRALAAEIYRLRGTTGPTPKDHR